jgi:hypothetical protein
MRGCAARPKEDQQMSDKKASASSRIVTGLVGAGAAFVARKLLSFAWTKITLKTRRFVSARR